MVSVRGSETALLQYRWSLPYRIECDIDEAILFPLASGMRDPVSAGDQPPHSITTE